MKIEIQNTDPSGCNDYRIYDITDRRFVENHTRNIDKRFFDEEEIINLLGESQYRKFEEGKFKFNVSKKSIFDVSQNINYYTPIR
jgi:hypothetical protein